METERKTQRQPFFPRVARYRHPMRYWTAVTVLAVIVGAVATANHLPALAELATLALLVGLVMLARTAWQRRKAQRDTNV